METATPRGQHASGTTGADDEHFERDVMPLAAELYRRALAYTKNPADAEDLVQDTMLKAYGAYRRLREGTRHRPWLLAIMRNTWISNHRRALRRPMESLVGDLADGGMDHALVAASAHIPSAETQVLSQDLDPQVAAALLKLSDGMRQTLRLVVVDGMKCAEAAAIMGVSEGAVLSRMHRIRNDLRDSLTELALERSRGGCRRAAATDHEGAR